MLSFTLICAVAISLGALFIGRNWGLRAARKQATKALKAQAAELQQQQREQSTAQQQRSAQLQKIQKATTVEEVSHEIGKANDAWNAGG